MTEASKFANPPNGTGVLLVGVGVSMDPTCDQSGLPAGNFSVQPPLPSGLTLDAETGKIRGTPIHDTPRRDYTVKLANPSGETVFTLSLEVQKHIPHICICMRVRVCMRMHVYMYI